MPGADTGPLLGGAGQSGELRLLPFTPPTAAPWEEGLDDWEISLRLRGGSRRSDPPDKVLEDALATVRAYAPLDAVFYTGMSAEGGFDHGGSAMVETTGDPGYPDFPVKRSLVVQRYAPSFDTGVCSGAVCFATG